MKIAGIIAEYNPFHKGHEYQIRHTKEGLGADYIIAVMSGDYVQRGTPALLPKHARTEMALRSGIDLVLELPASCACSSAEFFAQGGVSLLDGLGVVNLLCFGSEEGEMPLFHTIANVLVKEPEEYRLELQKHLKAGAAFPIARREALKKYFSNSDSSVSLEKLSAFLSSPNNILGLEYCKALLRFNSSIQPITLKREGADYHEDSIISGIAPSASGVRKYLETLSSDQRNTLQIKEDLSGLLPDSSIEILANHVSRKQFLTERDFDTLLHYSLLSENTDSLCQYLDVSPDLAARIIKLRNQYQGFSQFTELLKTKELTYTRIQRALLHIVLNIKESPCTIPYARVLGFRRSAGPLMKEIKKEGRIPLVTKLADAEKVLCEDALSLLNQNTYASNVYESLLCHKANDNFVHEYEKQLIIL